MSELKTDVLICGAGPFGLLVALGLSQQGISTYVIEKRERQVQAAYGRACSLYCRSIELLEQLGLSDDMLQEGFVCRAGATFKDGQRVTERGWNITFESMPNTFHDYILNIRQKYSEDIFREKYTEASGSSVHYGWRLADFRMEKLEADDYNITAYVENGGSGQKKTIRWQPTPGSKYLVGADGGQSTVRELAKIAMEADDTTHKWVRVDGKMNTDMPDANIGLGAIESPIHGHVLWVKLDRDAHRIGFSLTPPLQAKYAGGMTQEQAVQEAIVAMRPFKLDIERVDWWASYSIKQRVATTFQKDDFVLLGGDAAHVHSSGFAQGMNTAIHDATNLAWKLAGTLKGDYSPSVLASYATERRSAAQKLIDIDRSASAAISGEIPAAYRARAADAHEAVWKIFSDNVSFNVGLSVTYPSSIIARPPLVGSVHEGTRGPDALLRRLGSLLPIRLHDVASGKGRWSLVVFAGYHHLTGSKVSAVRDALLQSSGLGVRHSGRLRMATLLVGYVGGAWDSFQGPAVGRLYLDPEGRAHDSYGISREGGAIVVLRPDGILGFAASLDQLTEVESFFDSFTS